MVRYYYTLQVYILNIVMVLVYVVKNTINNIK